jgi:hypothetical protein
LEHTFFTGRIARRLARRAQSDEGYRPISDLVKRPDEKVRTAVELEHGLVSRR